jgi:hypothetical protein
MIMTERVGYKRPPHATRWKKGESGNPRGRQKGTPNLKTELAAELGEIIQIKEGGAPRKITKQRALLKALTAKAIQGDSRAAAIVVNMMMRILDHEPPKTEEVRVSAEDSAIIEAFLQQHQSTSDGTK